MKNTYSLRCLVSVLLILITSVIYAEQGDNADSATAPTKKLGTTFSWSPSGTFFYDAARFKDSDVKSLLENAIINELSNKGYTFSESGENTDFYINYIVILEEKLSDDAVSSIVNEYPELNQADINTDNFEYGTFIISAITASDRVKFWKNSTNTLVNLQMSDETRKQRLKDGAKNVLESFPASSK